jgi:3-hydroxyacyl-[acyl-carrier-protein] dehydratase
MSLDTVKSKIPHREPFLFLDEVISIDTQHAVGQRLIRAEEPQFQGHYPHNPIMPGVLLCEGLFQLGAYFLVHKLEQEFQTLGDKTPVLARIKEAKFKKIVRPGDTLLMRVELEETLGNFFFLKGSIKVKDSLVMSVSFSLSYV